MDEEISRYIEFYNWVYERIGQIVIADFDQVINDFNVIIKDINYQYDKLFLLLDNVKKADIQVKNDIEKRYDELGQTKMSHIKPVPTDGRNIEKEKHHDDVLIHDDFYKAKKAYEDIYFF